MKTTKKQWTVSNTNNAEYVGVLEIQLDYKDNNTSQDPSFTVLLSTESDDTMRLVFGDYCNNGFIESGYMELLEDETDERTDEPLAELLEELQVYYMDGPAYTNRIICNERM